MESIKRSRSNITDNYDNDSKRKKASITIIKTQCLTQKPITVFEDLSNELIYEIFEFLDLHHAFQTFYNLNKRFQNLFVHSNLSIKINISSISKSTFQHYLECIITPHAKRITSLRLSNPFAGNMFLLLTELTKLTTLVINNIKSVYIEDVIYNLRFLRVLSLTITSVDYIENQDVMYENIFNVARLKYCQLLIETRNGSYSLPIPTNKFSSIEHLVINNEVWLHQLDSLLLYVPQLRRLSLGKLGTYGPLQRRIKSVRLNYLTNVSLKLNSISFYNFESLTEDFFRQVQTLRITVYSNDRYGFDTEYLNANQWERLISTLLPNLRIFDFQQYYPVLNHYEYQEVCDILVNNFNSLFWIKRKWFFEYRYCRRQDNNTIIFYSTDPYRRKFYSLCEEPNKDIGSNHFQTNVKSVQQLCIYSTNAIKQFVGYFPNVTEVTLSEYCDASHNSLATSLNHIIPVRQLTQLIIDCQRFSFEHLVELLSLTPNMHTLKFHSIQFYETDSVSVQRSETFILASKTNTVTNVTIEQECTLDQIQLLTNLFPRVEYLTINLFKENSESILRFLLLKTSSGTRYLSLLCISKVCKGLVKQLKTLIQSENLLDDYTIKMINGKWYLWW